MEILLALIIAVLCGVGVFLTLRARTYPVVLGLTLLAYAVNLFLFVMGRLSLNVPAIIQDGASNYTDPLPQAVIPKLITIAVRTKA